MIILPSNFESGLPVMYAEYVLISFVYVWNMYLKSMCINVLLLLT